MEQFKYKARKRDGSVISGIVNAPNKEAVAVFIRKQDMFVAKIEPAKAKDILSLEIFDEYIIVYDVSIFSRQFATLFGS